ncbi:MAG: DUF72 domain-containing protein [Nitrospirota bacterium]
MSIYIGTSGYNYRHWADGVFYPSGLPQRKWLEFYTEYFNTVELNVTFYRLPSDKVFTGWYKRTPADFRFAVKGSRFITHIKRLKDASDALKIFFERVVNLKEKLSVILWQLSPAFKADTERLGEFIKMLREFHVRNVFEFREESWFSAEIFDLLRENNISFCMADYPDFGVKVPPTADFVYIRRHGEGGSYATSYSNKALKRAASDIKRWSKEGKDVYIYFNNDAFGYAVKNAMELKKML